MEMKSMAAANKKVSNYIPDDITFSILSKLPVKSLKRFECVQKSWSLLFENQHFMNMFRNNFLSYKNDPSSIILRVSNYRKEVFYSFSGERFENKVKLDWTNPCINFVDFGSVNGKFCLYSDINDSKIVLWTPATHTIKILPSGEFKLFIPDEAKDYVSVDYFVHGFGYDHVINDYKVIRYVEFSGDAEEDISLDWLEGLDCDPIWEIYSLRSNTWRKLHVHMPYSLQGNDGTQVYMDGVCHWLCEEDSEEDCEEDCEDFEDCDYKCLVSFYLSNEKFFVTPLPSDVDDCFDTKASWINLAVLNECITLVSYHKKTTTFHISILGEFGTKESWTKLLIVGPLPCVRHPMKMGMKGEIFFERKDGKLVWLDLSTQMILKLGYKGWGYEKQIITYKESILPIEGISN